MSLAWAGRAAVAVCCALGGFAGAYAYFLSTETPMTWLARVTRLR